MSEHNVNERVHAPGFCEVGGLFRLDDLPAGYVLRLGDLNWVSSCWAQATFTFCELVPDRHVHLCVRHALPVINMLAVQS